MNAISSVCSYHICIIGCVRQYIATDACKTLAQALITSQPHYGNIPLNGLSSTLMEHEQNV